MRLRKNKWEKEIIFKEKEEFLRIRLLSENQEEFGGIRLIFLELGCLSKIKEGDFNPFFLDMREKKGWFFFIF